MELWFEVETREFRSKRRSENKKKKYLKNFKQNWDRLPSGKRLFNVQINTKYLLFALLTRGMKRVGLERYKAVYFFVVRNNYLMTNFPTN